VSKNSCVSLNVTLLRRTKGRAKVLRASLVSATSLLALLLLEGPEAHSAPSITAGESVAFNGVFSDDGAIAETSPTTIIGDDGAGPTFSGVPAWVLGQATGSNFGSIAATHFSASGYDTFTPTTVGGSTSATVSFNDGAPGGTSQTVTLSGENAAPLETISTANQSVLSGRTGSEKLALTNVSGGNGGSAIPNSTTHWTASAGNSVFVGSASTFSLRGGSSGAGSASSASFGYSFTPSGNGAAPTSIGAPGGGSKPSNNGFLSYVSDSGDSKYAITGAAYIPNGGNPAKGAGNGGGRANTFAGAGSSTLGYTYTPGSRGSGSSPPQQASGGSNGSANTVSRSVRAPSTRNTAGPIFASSLVGSGVADTPTAVAHGAVGAPSSVIDFGTIKLNSSNTLNLALQNLSTDLNSSGSNLTIEGYTITGADASSFSVGSLSAGTVIDAGGTLVVPITVVGTGVGELSSNLTIFTNEGAGLAGAGDSFTYFLDPTVVTAQTTPTPSPEPASLAILGAGLAGLASIRRHRRAQ
jgi:PEP-CTERM motif